MEVQIMKVRSFACFAAITLVLAGCQAKNSQNEVGPGIGLASKSVSGQFNGFYLDTVEDVEYAGLSGDISVFEGDDTYVRVEYGVEPSDVIEDADWDRGTDNNVFRAETKTSDGYYVVTSDSEELLGIFLRSMELNGKECDKEFNIEYTE